MSLYLHMSSLISPHHIICQKHFCYLHSHKTLSIFHNVLLIDCAHNTDVYKGIKPLKLLCWRGGNIMCILCIYEQSVYASACSTKAHRPHRLTFLWGGHQPYIIVMSKHTAAKLCTKLPTSLKVKGGSGALMQPCTLTPVSLHWPRGWGLQSQLHLQPPLVFNPNSRVSEVFPMHSTDFLYNLTRLADQMQHGSIPRKHLSLQFKRGNI